MSFDQFRLDSRLLEAISTNGFTEPTPIQEKAIPVVLSGRDVVGLAQTGTGKTAAFGLPILQDLLTRPGRDRRAPRALVLAPTRELAEQIRQSLDSLARYTKLRTLAVYGGVSKVPQIQALRRGVDIIVACPGRLLDLYGDRVVDLSQVRTAVLDEADHMLDMGFLPDVRKILGYLPRDRKTLLFSATMPTEIRGLASSALRDPVEVRIGRVEPAKTVTQGLYEVTSAPEKTALLVALMQDLRGEKVLVFTRTKHRAMALARKLSRAGHRVAALQGNLSQNQRDKAITGFKGTKIDVLVATDIAARGIDVAEIAQVINYDITDTVEAYTHRIGRTGRAQKTGRAVTFVMSEDADVLRQIERTTNARIERLPLPELFQVQAAAALSSPRGPRDLEGRDESSEPSARPSRRRARGSSEATRNGRSSERTSQNERKPRGERTPRNGRSSRSERTPRRAVGDRPADRSTARVSARSAGGGRTRRGQPTDARLQERLHGSEQRTPRNGGDRRRRGEGARHAADTTPRRNGGRDPRRGRGDVELVRSEERDDRVRVLVASTEDDARSDYGRRPQRRRGRR